MKENEHPVTLDELVKLFNEKIWYKSFEERRVLIHELALRIANNGYSYNVTTEVVVKKSNEKYPTCHFC
jgi:hypothetical protein